MFDGLTFDPSASQAAVVVFIIAMAVFIVVLIRVLRMPQKKVDHLSRLPLQDEPESKSTKES